MRIALFFVAFTLGAGLALGLDAADAADRHEREQRRNEAVTMVVPETPGGQEIEVQPVRWDGALPVTSSARIEAPSSWSPGAGDVALAVAAVATVGGGVVLRRRVRLVPVRV